MKAMYRRRFCFPDFSCICLALKIMSAVPWLRLKSHCVSGRFCSTVGIGRLDKVLANIFSATTKWRYLSVVFSLSLVSLFKNDNNGGFSKIDLIMMRETPETNNLENDPSVRFGKILAHPPPGEEVIISGISGNFPLSDNMDEFKYNLDNKIEMITIGDKVHPEIPPGVGKLKDPTRFDTGFFEVHKRHALTLSAMSKIIMEKCVEAIFDAGLHPSDLEGTNTGVFLGVCFSESEFYWYLVQQEKDANTIIGNHRSVFAHRVSHFLKLKGPSFSVDTACSSGAYALESAFKAIRMGECDATLVIGANMILAGGATLQFARLGVLSSDGHCRPFDAAGTGYVRSEAIVSVLLQKSKDCKRIYAKLLHAKTNCDGYKEEGITYPSGVAQYNLLKEMYSESGVNPLDMSYIEAHGTGTIVGDPEELNSVDAFFCKERKTPLLVGSVKSSIGHSEPVSILCSLAKVILAFETDIISPNINYKCPRETIPGITQGRLEVVVENTPFRDKNGLVGVSSFGFGGGNAHAILKQNPKLKIRKRDDALPRLVCLSGRTEKAVNVLLEDVAQKFDDEHIGLIHNIFRKPIKNHTYRGYIIVSSKGLHKKSIAAFNPSKSNLHISFGGIFCQPSSLLENLLSLNLFNNFKIKLKNFFSKKKLDLDAIVSNSNHSNFTLFLVDLLTQLTLTELLKQLDIDNCMSIFEESFGKFSSAYYQNWISLEQFLECTYAIAKVTEKVEVYKKSKGFSEEALKKFKCNILEELEKNLPSPKLVNGFHGSHVQTACPEYFLEAIFSSQIKNNKRSPSKNCLILEIGQSIASQANRCQILNLSSQTDLVGLLEILGRLYMHGLQPQVQKLYNKVEFPVSRGTPMISSKIKWKHEVEHFIPSFDCNLRKSEVMVFKIGLHEEEWASLDGHIIDGRNLFPATGYLYLAWTVLTQLSSKDLSNFKVVFENCRFLRACTLSKPSSGNCLELHVMIQRQSGNFEITEGEVPVVTGRIRMDDNQDHILPSSIIMNNFKDIEVLSSRDIYKELRLRGYNYKGLYKGITASNKWATQGKIKWAENWIAFMDNMLQMKILGEDTRLLFVPTSIAKLTINPVLHLEYVEALRLANEEDVPVEVNYDSEIICSGGIQIQGLLASSIPRRKIVAMPVLEKYLFIPNKANLAKTEAIRVFMQIALENNCGHKVKAVELLDEATENAAPLAPIIEEALGDQPLIQSDIIILSKEDLELSVKVEDKKLQEQNECTVVIGSKLLSRSGILQDALKATKEDGYILTRERLAVDTSAINVPNLEVLHVSVTLEEKLVFLKKKSVTSKTKVFINVSQKTKKHEWLEKLKEAVRKDVDVVTWCQDEPLNGVIGLVNCIRREPECNSVRSLFIVDKAPAFNPDLPFYRTQLDKNLAVNVYRDGCWGTYRHLILNDIEEVESEHCYANSTVRGDLSSIKWIEGPLRKQMKITAKEALVEIFYSSLNFRDIMTASGRINVDVITKDRREQECVQGFEFSGKTLSGRRVMGMLAQGTLATLVKADNSLTWEVPPKWSLKKAATVPVVYGTCLYALVVVGKIRNCDSVLIHSGTGGIGQAAINLCLNMGCTVFTTVGTEEKRNFIRRQYPQINGNHIGNSRDLSFEQMIKKETNGRGVDIILNSLAEDKLLASVRCLAKNGRFLEIGKFDLANNNALGLVAFETGGSYHGVMLDKLFNETDTVKLELKELVQKYIDLGAVKPLKPTVFEKHDVEHAFRFMTTGRHMGKVLVEIRKEEAVKHEEKFKGLARYFCDSTKTYVICGGLGGFGLELADWLVLRGAKNLVLTSRKGVTTGYQNYRISLWKSYGCNIRISTQDITKNIGCETLIREANSLAPVAAVFNLAVVLRDALLSNQTAEAFEESFGPKACATDYLDQATRAMCPELRNFVVFSSVSCGRGNAGQTNYGMSNSVMERICEERRKSGFPALAIQWGAIGDVGLVAEMQEDHMELEIGGTLQQSIANCLQVMDILLRQNEAAILSSMVVAEKKSSSLSASIVDVVCEILGIRDVKSVSIQSTLAELGMDSMTGVEVKQTLEREFNIFLSPTEMRSITLARIQEFQEKGCSVSESDSASNDIVDWANILKDLIKVEQQKSSIVKLKSLNSPKDTKVLPKILAFPGIEGVCEILQNLTEQLEVEAFGVNYIIETQQNSIPKMAEVLLPEIKQFLQTHKSFHILAHSVGCNIALEVLSKLEKLGYLGSIIFIDGSPEFLKKLINLTTGSGSSEVLENIVVANILKMQLNDLDTKKIMENICKCSSLDEKLRLLAANFKFDQRLTEPFIINITKAALQRMNACTTYIPSCGKLKSKIHLYKPTAVSVSFDKQDYDIQQYFEEVVEVKVFDGTHTTILKNKELAEDIMKIFN
ncbi:unnamed protein product [Ceutorhynchus assimilis]|uniref:oleoyl-[acyl-carrier-protein] hydrolase n=1 Tax=Ceutorhynchus assimilis TaxID=467358 RepID=A0A9N9MWW8_9CUCU|nr:unnamed protein product [Ceutorhynchus assimilis]